MTLTTAQFTALMIVCAGVMAIAAYVAATEPRFMGHKPKHAATLIEDPDDDGSAYVAALRADTCQFAGNSDAVHVEIASVPPWELPGAEEDTGVIPHAVGTWGMTVPQLVDKLERESRSVCTA